MGWFQFQPNQMDRTYPATTKQEIVTAFESALSGVGGAGWTVISGVGSADVKMQSQLGAPSGLQCRVRARDPGVSATTRITFMNTGESKVSTELFLLPGLAQSIRIVAGGHQLFAFFPGDLSARKFVCGGVPYLDPWQVPLYNEAVWCHGNAESDSDVTRRNSFRTGPAVVDNAQNVWQLWMGVAYTGSGVAYGQRLIAPMGLMTQNPDNHYGRYFADGSAFKSPAQIAWGAVSGDTDSQIRGWLWGAAVIAKLISAEHMTDFEGRRWVNVMQWDAGVGANTRISGLYLAVN